MVKYTTVESVDLKLQHWSKLFIYPKISVFKCFVPNKARIIETKYFICDMILSLSKNDTIELLSIYLLEICYDSSFFDGCV